MQEPYFLYADDDPDDQLFVKEMIDRLNPNFSVMCCPQGLELMQFLETLKEGDTLPCCIILDINMPIWNGLRTLKEIKKRNAFQDIPVIMYTTSLSEKDREASLEMGADYYTVKPTTNSEFEHTRTIFASYCATASLQRL